MQKLSEASERKERRRMRKEKDRPDKRVNLILFQQWPTECQYLDRSC